MTQDAVWRPWMRARIDAVRVEEREACARIVEEQGCAAPCLAAYYGPGMDLDVSTPHEEACPVALAAAIRARGQGKKDVSEANEREACAQLAELGGQPEGTPQAYPPSLPELGKHTYRIGYSDACRDIALAIRAQGDKS